MNIYIASRLKQREFVKTQVKLLSLKGHKFLFDWCNKELNLKPYSSNVLSKKYSLEIHDAITHSDVFILLSDLEGQDMFIELGIALESLNHSNKPKIFVVGADKNISLMHNHPKIIHVSKIEDVYSKERLL